MQLDSFQFHSNPYPSTQAKLFFGLSIPFESQSENCGIEAPLNQLLPIQLFSLSGEKFGQHSKEGENTNLFFL